MRLINQHQGEVTSKVSFDLVYSFCVIVNPFLYLDFLKSLAEDLRVETSMKFVAKMTVFSRQKPGGLAVSPSLPRAIRENLSCLICAMQGTCLGTSCLGHKGKLELFILNKH